MPTELEAKLRVPSLDAVRERLADVGAKYIGRVREVNHILDRTTDPLWRRGMALRVRGIERLDGDALSPTLTFKGPARAERFKAREEIEVAVSDAEQTLAILKHVGLEPTVVYEKYRESWQLDGCRIELDELPVLGTFVEIEAASATLIQKTQQNLGLAAILHVDESYIALTVKHCTDQRIEPRELRFTQRS